jgi:hypothetical protein
MRAIFIDATPKTVAEIDHSGTLEDMQKTIGCASVRLITVGNEDEDHDLWIDDEGIGKAGLIYGKHEVSGNGLLLDSDDDGESAPSTVDIEDARAKVRFEG